MHLQTSYAVPTWQTNYDTTLMNTTSTQSVSQAKNCRKRKGRKWKKPAGMPKRPLSAYNLFFAKERKSLLKAAERSPARASEDETNQNGKNMGFANLARAVAAKWKVISDAEKEPFALEATEEQRRYKIALEEWKSLGLDPRSKRQKCSVKSSSSKDNGIATKAERVVGPPSIFVTPVGNDAVCNRNTLISGFADSIFGDHASYGTPENSANNLVLVPSQPVNVQPHDVSRIQDINGAGEKPGSKATQPKYNELSSRLFRKLNCELDNDEVGYLKSAFARSA